MRFIYLPVLPLVVGIIQICWQYYLLELVVWHNFLFLGRYSLSKAVCIAFVLTFFSAFDVPVFWPILLFYWLVLFVSTMKRQIMHMVKYKYVPFTFGKQRYGKKAPSTDERSVSKPWGSKWNELFMVGNEFVFDTNSPRWLYFSPDRFLSLGYVIEYMIINEFLDYKT